MAQEEASGGHWRTELLNLAEQGLTIRTCLLARMQVHKMRVDMIRQSLAAPESVMRILADYPVNPRADPPPSM